MEASHVSAAGPPQASEVLHDLGFFGHYLHLHAGGRGGKQFVLVTLHKHDGSCTQRELLEISKISSASLSEVLSKLEAEGFVTREACERDRRQLNIRLTEAGQHKARQIRAERDDFERSAFSCLSADELATLADLLHTIKQHWKSFDGKEVSA